MPTSASRPSARRPIQAKLAVGPAGDEYEREADAASERVTAGKAVEMISRLPVEPPASSEGLRPEATAQTPGVQRQCAACAEEQARGGIQRKCASCAQAEHKEARRETQGGSAAPDHTGLDTSRAEQAMGRAGAGVPLDPAMRTTMEQRFGTDFTGVRVHRGPGADEANRALRAHAFTRGSDIYLARDASPNDDGLMAHELTHVVQQSSTYRPPVQRQEAEEDEPALMAALDREYEINVQNGNQDADLLLRAYANRVALLLSRQHPLLRNQEDLDSLLNSSYTLANTELGTLDALGSTAELGLALAPKGFPLTWSGRIQAALTLGIDPGTIVAEGVMALGDIITQSQGLAGAIIASGLPVSLQDISRLSGFRLRLSDARNERGGAIPEFARATIRYMQLRFVSLFALTWELNVNRIAEAVADGSFVPNYLDWKNFVDNKQQILRELPQRARDRLAVSEEEAQQIETDTNGITDAAVGLGMTSALIGGLAGILGGWKIGADLFDQQMQYADAIVAASGGGERLTMALNWAWDNSYFSGGAGEFVDQLIANGPKILATIAAIIILQFIPGVDVALDIYLAYEGASGVLKFRDELGTALSAAMNATTVVTLQQAAASLARVLSAGAIQILIILAAFGVARAVKGLRARAAELREADAALSQAEAEKRALNELSPEERAPLEVARNAEFEGWKKTLSREDQALLDDPANAALKKRWTEMNPVARRILTHCSPSCIPTNATTAQASQIEGIVNRLSVKGDLEAQLKEYFFRRRDVLQSAIDDVAGATKLEELESIVYRSPVVPPGATADTATRIGEFTGRFKLKPPEEAALREYLQLRSADLDAALKRIDGIRDQNQLLKVLREAAEERAPAAEGTPGIPKGKSSYSHARAEHSADESFDHMTNRAKSKPNYETGGVGVNQGQWYNDSLIVEADQRFLIRNLADPGADGFVLSRGKFVANLPFGRPAGRVFLPDGLVVSDAAWIRIIRNRDGSFFDAFPITEPGVSY